MRDVNGGGGQESLYHQILVPETNHGGWLVVCIVAALATNLLNKGVCHILAFPFTFKSILR
jgi:hypothetical protein